MRRGRDNGEPPNDPAKEGLRGELFDSIEDARVAIELRPGKFSAEVLSTGDLRWILPVALAERILGDYEREYQRRRAEVDGRRVRRPRAPQ